MTFPCLSCCGRALESLARGDSTVAVGPAGLTSAHSSQNTSAACAGCLSDACARASDVPSNPGQALMHAQEYLVVDDRPRKVLVCGWGEQSFMRALLRELDQGQVRGAGFGRWGVGHSVIVKESDQSCRNRPGEDCFGGRTVDRGLRFGCVGTRPCVLSVAPGAAEISG